MLLLVVFMRIPPAPDRQGGIFAAHATLSQIGDSRKETGFGIRAFDIARAIGGFRMKGRFLLALVLAAAAGPAIAREVDVPMFGCKSDGQQGPQPAPQDGINPLPLSPADAEAFA
jgi:hypothetical protein